MKNFFKRKKKTFYNRFRYLKLIILCVVWKLKVITDENSLIEYKHQLGSTESRESEQFFSENGHKMDSMGRANASTARSIEHIILYTLRNLLRTIDCFDSNLLIGKCHSHVIVKEFHWSKFNRIPEFWNPEKNNHVFFFICKKYVFFKEFFRLKWNCLTDGEIRFKLN